MFWGYVLNPIPHLVLGETKWKGQRALGTVLSTVPLPRPWLVAEVGVLCALLPESSRLPSTSFPPFPMGCLLHPPFQPAPKPVFSHPHFFLPPIFVSPSCSLLKKKKKNQQNQSTERLDLQMSGQETGNKGNQSEEGAGIITVINSSSRDTAPPLRLGGVERQALQGRLRGAGCQGELRHCPLLTVG